jgi:hypothetical protein
MALPELRLAHQVVESHQHAHRDRDHDDGLGLDGHLQGQDMGRLEAGVARVVQVELVVPEALHQAHEILQEERHADGRDERDQAVGAAAAAQRPVGQPLDGHGGAARHAGRDHHGQQRERVGVAHVRAQVAVDLHAGHRPDHEDLGMGEVDEAQHAIDHGVAERDHGVHAAQQESLKQDAGQKF